MSSSSPPVFFSPAVDAPSAGAAPPPATASLEPMRAMPAAPMLTNSRSAPCHRRGGWGGVRTPHKTMGGDRGWQRAHGMGHGGRWGRKGPSGCIGAAASDLLRLFRWRRLSPVFQEWQVGDDRRDVVAVVALLAPPVVGRHAHQPSRRLRCILLPILPRAGHRRSSRALARTRVHSRALACTRVQSRAITGGAGPSRAARQPPSLGKA